MWYLEKDFTFWSLFSLYINQTEGSLIILSLYKREENSIVKPKVCKQNQDKRTNNKFNECHE